MDRIAYADNIPIVLRSPFTPATSVFVASLTDEPNIGTTLTVANFIPLSERLSWLAANDPFNAIIASRNENENISTDTRFFFIDFVMPSDFSGE